MMVLVASDKFKYSLSTLEVNAAIIAALQKYQPTNEFFFHPLANGGDGSLDVFKAHTDVSLFEMDCLDP